LQKEKNNAEYIAMLKQSMAEAEAGGFIAKTIEELEACEK
jgi:antitoxin YefM